MTVPRRAASLLAQRKMKTPDATRARQLAWLAICLYLVGLGISATFRAQGDFNVYYRAGHRVLHGHAIYPPDDSDRFLYAPIFAIAFAPLALLPHHLAQFVFFAVNAFSLIELILGAGVILFGRERKLPAALIIVPVLLSFRFIDNNFDHGQINLPTLALIVWAIVYAGESRDAWAGMMLAAAILIKPFALLAAIHLALRKHFATLGWAVAAGVALLVVPIVIFGPAPIRRSDRSVRDRDRFDDKSIPHDAHEPVGRVGGRAPDESSHWCRCGNVADRHDGRNGSRDSARRGSVALGLDERRIEEV